MAVNADSTWQYIGGFEEVLAACCTPVERGKKWKKRKMDLNNSFKYLVE